MKTLCAALALTLASTVAVQAESGNFSIETMLTTTTGWVNQSGSVATFQAKPTSNPKLFELSGTYVNNASGTGCQGTPYPLIGYYYPSNGAMSWSVSWSNATADCQSMTGWTGYFDGNSINTDWNLVFGSGSSMQIEQGSDQFTYQSVNITDELPHALN